MYLRIRNNGVLDPKAIMLFGASTKRGDSNKIGYFGTGTKYAIAYFLRNDIDIVIISGNKPYALSVKKVALASSSGSREFDEVCLNDQPCNITTTLGPQWELWMALREIISNAMDEDGYSISIEEEIASEADPNSTSVYIQMTPQVQFCWDKRESWIILPGDVRTIAHQSGSGKVYRNGGRGNVTIYRKGIRVYTFDSEECSLDFDFNHIDINEMRHSDRFEVYMRMCSLLGDCSPDLKKELLLVSNKSTLINQIISNFLTVDSSWIDCLDGKMMVTTTQCTMFREELSGKDFFVVPDTVFNKFQSTIPDKLKHNSLLKYSNTTVNGLFKEKFLNPAQKDGYIKVRNILEKAGFELPEITFGQYHQQDILGSVEGDKIFISMKVFDKGLRELMDTILEELMHRESTLSDKTRAFQNYLISKMGSLILEKVKEVL